MTRIRFSTRRSIINLPTRQARGLTLIELLVVITILGMVTVATIPLLAPGGSSRKIRESARLVSSLLSQAQTQALTTGRPCGVWIERLGKGATDPTDPRLKQAIDLFLCEVPPPYCGDSLGSVCTVKGSDSNANNRRSITFGEPIPPGMVRQADRIRFNNRGDWYYIIGPAAADGYVSGTTLTVNPAPPFTGTDAVVSYQIYRQPEKTASQPVSLPTGSLIDLQFSGLGSSGNEFGYPNTLQKPVLIVFGPNGSLESVYYGNGTLLTQMSGSTVFLLIAKPADTSDTGALPNYADFENIWISINVQSGLVTTSEVASNVVASSPAQLANQLSLSRAFARTAQNMGGK
ncbi:MAG: prepilin-type N-terminal cleavage/methylation domain-containing protein [Planctomycetota bacterium]|nr:prepilin-type N-terminal cleavage/methylation domain-containing protein [Planctomycetota bacterium]